jgi:hypothetical protein
MARIAAERTDFFAVCTLQAKVASASATVMGALWRQRRMGLSGPIGEFLI